MTNKEQIFRCAHDLFNEKGYKDTNIAMIAEKAGIAVGSFYKHYDSKEALFFEIITKENEQQKKRLAKTFRQCEEDPVALLTRIITQNLAEMSSSRILREWNNKDIAHKLEQSFYERGEIESINEFFQNRLSECIRKWKREGQMREDFDDELIKAMLNSIHYVDVHKRDLGTQHFPQLVVFLAQFIIKGLTEGAKSL